MGEKGDVVVCVNDVGGGGGGDDDDNEDDDK